jgi:lysophospholipase L1-like esterase
MKTSFGVLCAVVAAFTFSVSAADKPFYLKEGDRVVFYGDSITDQRLYTTFTETFVVTRFPKLNATFVHSGWGGDRVTGGGGGKIDTRLQRDVIAYKPTVMTIMLGMNDASYRAFDQNIFDTYANGYSNIIQSVKKELPNIRITVIQPSPFDDVTRPPNFEGGYNAVLLRYGQFVKELGEREKLHFADLNTGVVDAVKKADAVHHENAIKLNPDRVHPAPAGQLLMAAELLQAWNAPALVTAVEVDAKGKKVVGTKTKASIQSGEGALSWTQEDEALPMFVDFNDPVFALALKSSDFTETLNQQTLKVSGLEDGQYSLTIDKEKFGPFAAADLAKGINLTSMMTPMMTQAREVHRLTLQHNEIHFLRWRNVQVKVSQDLQHLDEALKGLDALEEDIVKLQRAEAQPRKRTYTLTKQD